MRSASNLCLRTTTLKKVRVGVGEEASKANFEGAAEGEERERRKGLRQGALMGGLTERFKKELCEGWASFTQT